MASVRIVYLIPSLDGSGGAEQAVAALTGPLADRGVSLEVVTLGRRGREGGARPDAVARVVTEHGGQVTELSSGGRMAQVRELHRHLARRRPDLVHTTLFDADVVGRLAARWSSTPVVSSLVNVAYGPEQRANPALRAWKIEAVRWADLVTGRLVRRFQALSPHVAEVMGARLHIPRERIDVIPRGRNAEVLGEATLQRRHQVRAALGVPDDALLVVAAARHEYQKGLDVLIASWPRVRAERPHARVLIGGRRGNETARLEAAVAAQGPEAGIELLGRRDDVADLMVASDVFVVPSRWEGFGSILVEAMALGVTLVTTDVGPVPDVVGEGWARIVPAERPDALAAAVLEAAAQDRDEAARRSAVARARFEGSYRIEVVADATVAFYERALG
jgi:glycosyltransferase involved in cell wall biosynthesis